MFGSDQLDAAIRESADGGAEQIKMCVLDRMHTFLGGVAPQDDVSVLVVQRCGRDRRSMFGAVSRNLDIELQRVAAIALGRLERLDRRVDGELPDVVRTGKAVNDGSFAHRFHLQFVYAAARALLDPALDTVVTVRHRQNLSDGFHGWSSRL
jgi:hypothetical protein